MSERDEYDVVRVELLRARDRLHDLESYRRALELRLQFLEEQWREYRPIVDELKDKDMVATEIAKRVVERQKITLTWVHVSIAFAALFVPPIVAAYIMSLLTKGHP